MKKNTYPHLPGRQAKQRIAREIAEASEAERRFAEKFDNASDKPLRNLLGPDEIDAVKRERERVEAIITRDRAAHMREIERAAAEIKVREGLTVTAHETVMEPTEEWFQHGDSQPFTPEVPDGTVRVLKTVRRVRVPIILRMLHRGQIDNDQYRALNWYSECYEMAGLHGFIPIAQVGREVFGGGPDRVLFTESQQQAQRQLREVKSAIPKHMIRFFEAVVIDNVPITRASRFIRTKPANALKPFRKLAQDVTMKVDDLGILA